MLRVWRSSFLAARGRPLLTAQYSVVSGPDGTVQDLLNHLAPKSPDIFADSDSNPPTPGSEGYPPARENPLKPDSIQRHLLSKPKFRLHCHSTRNNTITTFTTQQGATIAWFSGGSCGFKKGNRASYEAGYQCAVRVFKKIEETATKEPFDLALFFKGFGQGRDAMQKALMTGEGEKIRPLVTTVTDRTPIKIGGTRAKKTRRL